MHIPSIGDVMVDESNTTRWTVSVSKETDIAVRSFLAQRGMKKGDLSKFIEDAVRWRVFDQTLAEVRGKFADIPPDQLEALLEEAVTATRQADKPKAG
jgi:Ribbon-helix-helix domain